MTHLEAFESAQADFQRLESTVNSLIVARDIFEAIPDFTEDETFVGSYLAARTFCIERANAALAGIKAEQAARRPWFRRMVAWAAQRAVTILSRFT